MLVTVPHAGQRGAELGRGAPAAGATLLRLTSPRTALRLGADFEYSHTSRGDGAGDPFIVDGDQTGSTFAWAFSGIGHRALNRCGRS